MSMMVSLAFYVHCAKVRGRKTQEQCCDAQDYHDFLQELESQARGDAEIAGFDNEQQLYNLSEIDLSQDQYYDIVNQVFSGTNFRLVCLPYPAAPLIVPPSHEFFERYIKEVIDGDRKTENAVNETIGRMNDILRKNELGAQRVSGLIVGRVQSGKTRNYIGVMLKAIDEGWNLIITLTSNNTALATQTRDRVDEDFGKAGATPQNSREINFLEDGRKAPFFNPPNGIFFHWGVAMKETSNLKRITDWLDQQGHAVSAMRILIIDDESDNATPDANTNQQQLFDEETLAEMIEEIREKDDSVADWFDNLQEREMPDTDAQTPEAQSYRNLENQLQAGTAADIMSAILNNQVYRSLLGMEDIRDENDELINLQENISNYFNANGNGERSKSRFVRLLRSILNISNSRSAINNRICAIVDKYQHNDDYTYSFQKCAYLGYTATPYACILNQRPDQTPLYADFIRSLEKSPQYFGLQEIFGYDTDTTVPHMPIIRSIPQNEKDWILNPLQGVRVEEQAATLRIDSDLHCECNSHRNEWDSMKEALAWAFCTAAARRYYRTEVAPRTEVASSPRDKRDARWTTMLVNISQKQAAHVDLQDKIKAHIESRCATPVAREQFGIFCRTVWDRLTQSFTVADFRGLFADYGDCRDYPAWENIENHLAFFMARWNNQNVHVITINSTQQGRLGQNAYNQTADAPQFAGDNLWIVCGGNTISRGLTLAGLTVSYFDRVRKSVAVDTMTQMGRWFGYRRNYELLPRIWMIPDTVTEMKKTAFIEDKMHTTMADNFKQGFSPSDPTHYQPIYSWGRKLSGRVRSKRDLTIGIGTYGSTDDISINPDHMKQLYNLTCEFISSCGPQSERDHEVYEYSDIPLWENISRGRIREYLEASKSCYPENSKRIIESLIREINGYENTDWDIIIGKPRQGGGRTYHLANCDDLEITSGQPDNVVIIGECAKYSGARLLVPYYAMIQSVYINRQDVEILKEDLGTVANAIALRTSLNNGDLPPQFDRVLPARGAGLMDRLKAYIHDLEANGCTQPLAESIHGRLREGFRNRSSAEYMEKVHAMAGHTRPTLQFYFLTPPERIAAGELPLISIAFYWPHHEPDIFHAVAVGMELVTLPRVSRGKFFQTVVEILSEHDFPMQTQALRTAILERLQDRCNEAFFAQNIANQPGGYPYQALDGRNAYFHTDWAEDSKAATAKLEQELLRCGIAILQGDGHPRNSRQLFEQVLIENPKLKGFFNLENPAHRALFNSLFTEQVMAGNNIHRISNRPITYQFQQF